MSQRACLRQRSQQISESQVSLVHREFQASDRTVWYRWERPGEAVRSLLTMVGTEGMLTFGTIIGSCRRSEHLEQEGGKGSSSKESQKEYKQVRKDTSTVTNWV